MKDLSPSRLIHPGMSNAFFDAAIARSFERPVSIRPTSMPGVYAIASATDPNVTYWTTEKECSCRAGTEIGRCWHRCRVILETALDRAAATERTG